MHISLPAVYNSAEQVRDFLEPLRKQGKTLVTTNGCFDLLHTGHVQYLIEAASLGDILAVGINSDSSVSQLKGSGRPLQSENNRAFLIASLKMVDCAFIFKEIDPKTFLSVLKPNIHVKGGDYNPDNLPEKEVVEKFGGRIKIVSFVDGYSTTSIIHKISTLPQTKQN